MIGKHMGDVQDSDQSESDEKEMLDLHNVATVPPLNRPSGPVRLAHDSPHDRTDIIPITPRVITNRNTSG